MDYLIKAHPTKYAGVEFRSRLEARWAAFFDLAGWRWDYEPIDFEGWTPDFEISHPEFHPPAIMVEVKPTWEMAHAVIPKIRNSGVQEAMLLANGPGEPLWCHGMFTYCKNLGAPMGVVCSFEYRDQDIYQTFMPRDWMEDNWKEAGNITRRKY